MYSRPSTAVPPLPILSQPRVLHPNALTPMTMRPEIGRLKGHLAASRPTTAGAASHTPRGLMTGDVALARGGSTRGAIGSPRNSPRGGSARSTRSGSHLLHRGGATRHAMMSSWVQSHAGMGGQLTYKDWSSPDVVFDLIDNDNSGAVTKSELRQFFRGSPLDPTKQEELFDALDIDGSGEVSRDEWRQGFFKAGFDGSAIVGQSTEGLGVLLGLVAAPRLTSFGGNQIKCFEGESRARRPRRVSEGDYESRLLDYECLLESLLREHETTLLQASAPPPPRPSQTILSQLNHLIPPSHCPRAPLLPSRVCVCRPLALLLSRLAADLAYGRMPASVPLAEERGITLHQLRTLWIHIQSRCIPEGWMGVDGKLLSPEKVSMYDVIRYVVKPATRKHGCSYVELVSEGPQRPSWVVIHWWGQPVQEVLASLEQHSKDRGVSDEVASYWIASFAFNQHVNTPFG